MYQAPYLQELPHARNHTTANELLHINATLSNRVWAGAANAINPLHDQHVLVAQVHADPWNLNAGIVTEVALKLLNVASLLQTEQNMQDICLYVHKRDASVWLPPCQAAVLLKKKPQVRNGNAQTQTNTPTLRSPLCAL